MCAAARCSSVKRASKVGLELQKVQKVSMSIASLPRCAISCTASSTPPGVVGTHCGGNHKQQSRDEMVESMRW